MKFIVLLFLNLLTATPGTQLVKPLTELEQIEFRCMDLLRQSYKNEKAVYDLCTRALEKYPNSGLLYFWRAKTCGKGYDNMMADYRKAIELGYEYSGDAYYNLAKQHFGFKEYEQASENILKAIQNNSHADDKFKLQSRILAKRVFEGSDAYAKRWGSFLLWEMHRKGMFAEGIVAATKLLKKFPKDPDIHFEMGRHLIENDLFDNALEFFDQALKYKYRNPGEIYYEKARCYEKLGQLETAYKLANLAIKNDFLNRDSATLQNELEMKIYLPD